MRIMKHLHLLVYITIIYLLYIDSIAFLFWSFGLLFLFFILFDVKSISNHQITETALRAFQIKDTRPEPEVIPVILNLFIVPTKHWIPVDAVDQRAIQENEENEEENERESQEEPINQSRPVEL